MANPWRSSRWYAGGAAHAILKRSEACLKEPSPIPVISPPFVASNRIDGGGGELKPAHRSQTPRESDRVAWEESSQRRTPRTSRSLFQCATMPRHSPAPLITWIVYQG